MQGVSISRRYDGAKLLSALQVMSENSTVIHWKPMKIG